jgi:hypothetical protein
VELEQRVQALEQELKLLKNEVQATLLDIQEQLLSRRYPALRAAEVTRPEAGAQQSEGEGVISVVSAIDAGTVEASTPPHVDQEPPVYRQQPTQPVQRPAPSPVVVHLDTDSTSEERTEPTASESAVRAGKTIRTSRPESEAVSPGESVEFANPVHPQEHENGRKPVDWEELNRQMTWTVESVRMFGAQRTRQLIKQYNRNGLMSDSASQILLRVAAAFQPNGASGHDETPAADELDGIDEATALYEVMERKAIARIIDHLQAGSADQEPTDG